MCSERQEMKSNSSDYDVSMMAVGPGTIRKPGFEYHVESISSRHAKHLQDSLTALGNEGWQLAASYNGLLVFIRPEGRYPANHTLKYTPEIEETIKANVTPRSEG